MEKFETALLAVIWDNILSRINVNSKVLQSKDCTLKACTIVYTSLFEWLNQIRSQFSRYEDEAEELIGHRTDK